MKLSNIRIMTIQLVMHVCIANAENSNLNEVIDTAVVILDENMYSNTSSVDNSSISS